MCDAFCQHGHDVMLLAKKGFSVKNNFKYYNLRNVFSIRILSNNNLLFNIICIAYQLMKFKPNLVYSRNVYGSFISTKLGFPTYLEIHDDRWRRGRIAPFLYKAINRDKNLKKVVSITSNLLKEYTFDWPNSTCKSFQILPDAADIPSIRFEKKVGIVTNKNSVLNVGYVGGLHKGKRLEVIQEVAQLVRNVKFHKLPIVQCD